MTFGENKKRFITILVVLVVLLGIAAYSFIRPPPKPGEEKDEEEPYDLIFPNYPVTTRELDNNEPTIVINPSDHNNMVAGSNDYNTPTGDAWPGFYTSHDGGETWTEKLIPGYPGDSGVSQLSGFRGGGDPVVVASNDGTFYFAGIAFKRSVNPLNPIGFGINLGLANCVFVAKSTDRGNNFEPVIVWAASQNLVRFNDKEWVAVDPNDSNYVYLVWSIFTGMLTARLLFSRSTDGGQTWSYPPTVISETTDGEINLQGSAIVVDNDANVHVTWVNFGDRMVRYAKSTNRGASFSTPVNVAPFTDIPGSLPNGNYRTPSMTMLAVDNSNTNLSGSLYVTWADYSNGDADVFLAYSNDNGNSWTGPVRVNNDTEEGNGIDQFFPAVAVSADGIVHVTFYDRRNDVNNTLLEYWWAMSFDGGQTFPVNLQISDVSFNGDYSRADTNDFIGDYTGVVATNDTVVAVWCDTREASESDPDSEIYFVAVPYLEVLEKLDIERNNSSE